MDNTSSSSDCFIKADPESPVAETDPPHSCQKQYTTPTHVSPPEIVVSGHEPNCEVFEAFENDLLTVLSTTNSPNPNPSIQFQNHEANDNTGHASQINDNVVYVKRYVNSTNSHIKTAGRGNNTVNIIETVQVVANASSAVDFRKSERYPVPFKRTAREVSEMNYRFIITEEQEESDTDEDENKDNNN